MSGADIVLVVTVSLNLTGYGWRTGQVEMPQHYSTIEECEAAAGREVGLSNDKRVVEAQCVRKG